MQLEALGAFTLGFLVDSSLKKNKNKFKYQLLVLQGGIVNASGGTRSVDGS